ncbi:C5A peptidase [Streptococcus pyogenes]|uniref:C5a peptidase ScpA/B n=1 Tax=Streptococcus pyogenes TaxID=1314 RepID=UPI0010A0DA6A|nr:C5a peptidase ScpA/B [Streptococcus pyogenes]WSE66376.1 C5a peptidase ScpA/B [Streptococcus pyogenes]VGU17801.1 C5A peptidase [Streptococcus pyogenes]
MRKKQKLPFDKLAIALMSTSILLNAQSDIKANTVTEDTPATEQAVETPQPTVVSEEAPSSKETKTPQTPGDAGETVADDANDLAPQAPAKTADTPATPKATIRDLNDPSQVKTLQEKAGKGAGTVVAVIDAGFDKNHEAWRLTDKTKARYQSKEDLEKAKKEHGITYGEWVNDKVAYYHDYSKDGKTAVDQEHGTHVSGILSGNAPSETKEPYRLEGAMPEAQLLLMRVEIVNGLADYARNYAQAIRDAVNLGAKVINMSFGNAALAYANLPDETKKAFDYAKSKGVSIVTSAGNDSSFGGKTRLPLADHPDYGVVGTPAAADSTLTVASYSPDKQLTETATVKTEDHQDKEMPVLSTNRFEPNKTYDYAYANRGTKEDDFKDVKGKIALIERGDIDFKDKIANAKKAGAVGVLIYDNQDKGFPIELPNVDQMPAAFISRKDGLLLKENPQKTITFNATPKVLPTASGTKLSRFSSWGLTADGNIKPDIAAPGQDILSSVANNKYAKLSGTSMSAPLVAGIMGLLQKQYETQYPDMTPSERLDLAKKVLMSSATALYDEDEKAYFSPRQQGAGAVDAKKASAATMYVTDKDSTSSKVHLNNVSDTFEVTVTVHNKSDKPQELYYQATVQTDKVDGKHFALAPKALYETSWQKITIPANRSKQVTVPIDASRFSKDLLAQMKNGYFLEGFVRFKQDPKKEELMSIPYIGFRGDFGNLSALEKPIYDSKDGSSYYHEANSDAKDQLDGDGLQFYALKNNFTALTTESNPWTIIKAVKEGVENIEDIESSEITETIFAGTFAKQDDDSHYYIHRHANGKPYAAISPNGDGNRDYVQFQGTFLRNAKNLVAEVLDKEGNVVWTSEVTEQVVKNYNNDLASTLGSTRFEKTRWDGKDKDGKVVANGTYTYRVRYTPISSGAKEQHTDFDVIVDNTTPEVATSATFSTEDRRLTLASKPKTSQPVYRERIAYTYMDEDLPTTEYISPNEDGTFTLPEEAETMEGATVPLKMSDFTYVVEDMAGNITYTPVTKLLEGHSNKPEQDGSDQAPDKKPETKPEQDGSGQAPDKKPETKPEQDGSGQAPDKKPETKPEKDSSGQTPGKTPQKGQPSRTLEKRSSKRALATKASTKDQLPTTNDKDTNRLHLLKLVMTTFFLGLVAHIFKTKRTED